MTDFTPPQVVTFHEGMIRVPYNGRHSVTEVCPLAALNRRSKKLGPVWIVPPMDAPAVVTWADRLRVEVDPAVRGYADGLWQREMDALALSKATSLPDEMRQQVEGLTTTLLPPQEVVLAAATRCWIDAPGREVRHRALLVADEPGLGKTVMSLAVLRTVGARIPRAVVVCPTSLTRNWIVEMDTHFESGTFTPWVATTRTPSEPPDGVDVVVIGWDILGAWAQTLIDWGPDAVIADEGHYAKSGRIRTTEKATAKLDADGKVEHDEEGKPIIDKVEEVTAGSTRATAVLDLGAAVAAAGGLILPLTGTPIVNRPAELEALLEFAGILHVFGDAVRYKQRYCGPETVKAGGRNITTYEGASHLLELNRRLSSSGHFVRRTKEMLVRDGTMKRKFVDGVYTFDYTTPPSPWMIYATDAEMDTYRLAQESLVEFLRLESARLAAELGLPLTHPRVRKRVSKEYRNLQQLTALRKEAAKVKVPYVIAKARELADSGEKVVIAAHHREVVDAYADAFTGLKIQGQMSVAAIEQAKEIFNGTPASEHPVLVLSVEAGKTGHTLCKQALNNAGPECRFMIFAEQVWTPGDESQAQDRIWRIGQTREVRIVNALLATSIDEVMHRKRAKKRANVVAAVDAIGAEESEQSGMWNIAWDMVGQPPGRR